MRQIKGGGIVTRKGKRNRRLSQILAPGYQLSQVNKTFPASLYRTMRSISRSRLEGQLYVWKLILLPITAVFLEDPFEGG